MRDWILAATVAILLPCSSVQAATLTVPSDAYPTIQAAVDSAVDGDTVLVRAGTFPETVSLVGRQNLVIRGTVRSVISLPGEAGFVLTGCTNISLSGFRVVSPDWVGVAIDQSTGISISRVTIEGARWGLEASGCVDLDLSRIVVVGSDGVTTQSGIEVGSSSDVRIAKCRVLGTQARTVVLGVFSRQSVGLSIDRCALTDVSDGVRVDPEPETNAAGTHILRNRILRAEIGIRASGDDLRIERNTIREIAEHGILVESFGALNARGVIVGNRVYGGSIVVGGDAGGGTEFEVSRNRVLGAGAMIFASGESHVLEGNIVRDGGVVVDAVETRLSGNRVRVPENGTGFEIYGSGLVVERNRASCRPGSGFGFHIASNSSSFTGNRTGGSAFGFYVHEGAAANMFTMNVATGSGVLDLAEGNAKGINTFENNRFRSILFGYIDE